MNRQDQIQLSLECIEASKEVSELFVPAISAVRQEMDIPFDEDSYKRTLGESWESSQESINEFYNKITEKIG